MALSIPITYADADYATCLDTRKSTTGVVTMMAGGPVFWMLKRQDVVALLTTEAEYIALAKALQQAKWVHQFLSEINHGHLLPVTVKADNQGSIILAENPKFFSRVKHIDIRHHYLRDDSPDEVSKGFVPTEQNPVDILTKTLGTTIHRRQVQMLGLNGGSLLV